MNNKITNVLVSSSARKIDQNWINRLQSNNNETSLTICNQRCASNNMVMNINK